MIHLETAEADIFVRTPKRERLMRVLRLATDLRHDLICHGAIFGLKPVLAVGETVPLEMEMRSAPITWLFTADVAELGGEDGLDVLRLRVTSAVIERARAAEPNR